MKREWIARVIVLAGLAVLAWWIAQNTYWSEVMLPSSLKGDAATNPFYSLEHLAKDLGARAERHYVLGTPPSSDAVVVLSYWDWNLIDDRRRRLEDWVAAGGRLIVDNTLIGAEDEFRRWSGIATHQPRQDQKAKAPSTEEEEGDEEEEDDATDASADAPILKSGADKCVALQVEPATAHRESYQLCNSYTDKTSLTSDRRPSWTLRDTFGLQGVRVNIGRGTVTVLNTSVFGNRQLLKGDHALLFVTAAQLKRGDEVIFLAESEQASLLSLAWTLGAPAVVLTLILLAVALWRGSMRFGPLTAPPDIARRSIAEQIRGTGQFELRFGGRALHAAMVRALHEAAERRIGGYSRMSVEARVAAISRIAKVEAEDLSATINYTGAQHAPQLRNAVMLLEHARRRLLEAKEVIEVKNAG